MGRQANIFWNSKPKGSPNGFYRSLTVNHANIPNTDQTNFPVLVSGTYTYLKTLVNGGKVTNASGFDIYFSASITGSPKLPFEIEDWSATSGVIDAWVNVASLSHTTDTVIYIFYGNPAIVTDQSNKTGTWNTAFQGVYHLGNGTTLSPNDSTSNAFNGTITSATAGAGKIGGGGSFSGVLQYITIGNHLGLTGDFTIQAWVNPTDFIGFNGILSKTLTNQPKPFEYRIDASTGKASLFVGDGSGNTSITASTATTAGVFNHVAVSFTQSTATISHYLNGTLNGSSVGAGYPGSTTGTDNAFIGTRSDNATMFKGIIDEVKMTNTVLTADWIKTEFNNQSSPSTFYTVGSETSA